MSLQEQINNDFKAAMKAGETQRKEALSLIRGVIQNKEIEKGKQGEGLSDEEVVEVLTTEAKRRKEAIHEYEKAGRDEQAAGERAELAVIEQYLPEQLSTEEVREKLQKIIDETGASSKEDFGKVMGTAMQELKGQADGNVVKEELEKLLS